MEKEGGRLGWVGGCHLREGDRMDGGRGGWVPGL